MAAKQFGQGKQRMDNTQRLTITDFSRMYGSVLARLEPLVIQAAEAGVQLGPNSDDMKEVMGLKFATEVGDLRVTIFGQYDATGKRIVEGLLLEEHKGPFDGYVKRLLEDDYGMKSEMVLELAKAEAAKRGIDPSDEKAMAELVVECDQYDNALAIVLPGQARKREFVSTCWLVFLKYAPQDLKTKYMTMPAKSADIRAFVTDLAPVVEDELTKLKLGRKGVAPGEEPKRSAFPKGVEGYQEYMNAKAAFQEKGKEKSPEEEELGKAKGAISWLTPKERTERQGQQGSAGGNTDGAKPPTLIEVADIDVRAVFETATMKMEELLGRVNTVELTDVYIQATTDWIAHLKGEERNFGLAADYANAADRQKEWRRIENIDLPKLRKKGEDLKAKAAMVTRLTGAAAIVASTPEARGTTVVPVGERAVINGTEVKTAEDAKAWVVLIKEAIGQRPTAEQYRTRIDEIMGQLTGQFAAVSAANAKMAELQPQYMAAAMDLDNLEEAQRLGVLIGTEKNRMKAAQGQIETHTKELNKLQGLIEATPAVEKKSDDVKQPVTGTVATAESILSPAEVQALLRGVNGHGGEVDEDELIDEIKKSDLDDQIKTALYAAVVQDAAKAKRRFTKLSAK